MRNAFAVYITLDEMSITPNVEYDTSSGQLLGNITLLVIAAVLRMHRLPEARVSGLRV